MRGTYVDSGLRGTLEGTTDGSTLVFAFSESDGSHGEGDFVFSDNSFTGKFRGLGSPAWQSWTGRRVVIDKAASRLPFVGLFHTSYGPMRLEQRGRRVRGQYLGETLGELRGTVSGNRLTFTYREGKEKGRGTFDFLPGAQGFTGRWRSKSGPFKPWLGRRAVPRPERRWLVVLEAYWERSLEESEYSFGGILRNYFLRMGTVRVRHRRLRNRDDFRAFVREAAFLAEPAVVVVAGHGSKHGVEIGKSVLGAKELASAFDIVGHNIELMHFSSCDIFAGTIPRTIAQILGKRAPAISGYAKPVDWSASALFELLYLELIVARMMSPKEAANIAQNELRFSGDTETASSPLGALHFRFQPTSPQRTY